MRRTARAVLLAMSIGSATAGSGCGPDLPMTPQVPSDARNPAFSAPERIELEGLAESQAPTYAVMPGDILSVRSISMDPFEAPDLVVDAEGYVHVPLAGAVEVAGMSVRDAEDRVAVAIRDYDRFARVSLTVSRAAGHRVTVLGAVTEPGVITLEPNMRLAEVIGLTGGTKVETAGEEMHDVADLDAARVIRDGVALPVSLGQALRGDPRHNIQLGAGDLVYVPSTRSLRVTVLGSVGDPKSFAYRPGLRLTEALAIAGGTTEDGDDGDIRIIRGPLSEPSVYRTAIEELYDGEGTDIQLAPGDVVFVTEHWFATTGRVLSRLTPLLAATAVGVAIAK